MASEPGVRPRPPRCLQRGRVARERRPPRRHVAVLAGGGPRVHEERRVARLESIEQLREALHAPRVRESAGGQAQADEALVEQGVDVAGPGIAQVERAPRAERARQPADDRAPGVEQRLRLARRERLHPQRRRQAQQRAVDALGGEPSGAVGALLGGDGARGSPGTCRRQAPASRRANGGSERRSSAARSSGGQRCWWTSVRGRTVIGGNKVLNVYWICAVLPNRALPARGGSRPGTGRRAPPRRRSGRVERREMPAMRGRIRRSLGPPG